MPMTITIRTLFISAVFKIKPKLNLNRSLRRRSKIKEESSVDRATTPITICRIEQLPSSNSSQRR